MNSKLRAIIVDLDGTLCNTEHRTHHVSNEWTKADYNAFYEKMDNDTPHKWCENLVWYHIGQRDKVFFITGRPETYRARTQKWLDERCALLPVHYELFMRDGNDHKTCDTIIKENYYREHIEPKYEVIYAIEDRNRVVKMWRSIGLTVLQCAEGDF